MNKVFKIGLCVLGLLVMSTSLFAKCPPDSIYKVVYRTVETRIGDTIFVPDVDSIAEIPSSISITQSPHIGDAHIEGLNLIFISETDRLGRDTLVCGLTTSQGVKYVKFIYHIINNSGMGRDFWFAFLEMHDEYAFHQQIEIVALQETHVTIQTEIETKNITLPENGWYQYVPTSDLSCQGSEVVQQKAIHITADHPISVVAGQIEKASIDITNILPKEALGTKYISMLQDTMWNSEICVVATEPTDVEIYPSQRTEKGVNPGGKIKVHLNQGQTYQIQSGRNVFSRLPSLAGTRINATKPIAVFEGTMCTDFPVDYGCCDHNYEQSLPTKYWGTRYVYVRLCVSYDRFRITAMFDNTVVTKNGEYFTTLQANESYIGFIFEDAAVFEANGPIALSQYMTSTALNAGGYGDPAILNVRPVESGIQHVIFDVPPGIIINDKKYTKLNIVATLDAIDSLTLDGQTLEFDPIVGYDSLYYTIVRGLDFGLHELKTPSGKFMATCVGAAIEETYCFTVTTSLEAIRDTLVQIEAEICDNEAYYFAGRCLDKTGIYYDTVYSPNWRDSVVELHLTVYPSYEITTDTVVTYWSSIDWRDHHLTNIIHDTLIIDSLQTVGAGCDSVYVLNLTAQCAKVDTFMVDTAVCASNWPYIWHTYRDIEITESGLYLDSIRGYKCDSIYYILHIEKLRVDSVDTTIFACRKELPYHWLGQSLSEEGTYKSTLTNRAGCDSVVTLTFFITSFCDPTRPIDPTVDCIDTTYSTIDTTFCDWELQTNGFMWFENMYYEAGTYHDTLVGQNYLFCDSVGTLILRTEECPCDTAYSFNEQTIKEKDDLPFTWNGMVVSAVPQNPQHDTTLVYQTRKADDSCDSIATLHLIVEPYPGSLTIIQTLEHFNYDTLQATPYVWPFTGEEYTEPGFYADTIIEVKDTTIGQLLLTVDYERTIYSCEGQKVDSIETPWGKFGFDTCTCLTGCLMQTIDSFCIVDAQLCVVYLNADTVREDTTLCYGTSIEWHGIKIDQTKEYEFHEPYKGPIACDSVVFYLNATVKDEPEEKPTVDAVCAGETYTWNTYRVHTITEPGTYNDTLKTADLKCDSILYSLYLTVIQCSCDTMRVTTDITLPYDTLQVRGGYMWFGELRDTAGVYRDTIQTVAGCDSIGLLILRVTYQDSMFVCGEDTAIFTTPWGDYGVPRTCECMEGWIRKTADDEGLVWAKLCVKRHEVMTGDTTAYFCEGSTFTWYDETYDAAGEYTHTMKSILTGCDSIVTLHLFEVPIPRMAIPGDTTINRGDSVLLKTEGADYYMWYSKDSVRVTDEGDSYAIPSQSAMYYVMGYSSSESEESNLVKNGSFTNGNVDFETDLTYFVPYLSIGNYGEYTITDDVLGFWPLPDRIDSHKAYGDSGNMMVMDGMNVPNAIVWKQTIDVVPHTYYSFSTQVMSCWESNQMGQYALLQFSVNDTPVGPIYHSPNELYAWSKFYDIWYSGDNTTATLKILNQNISGEGNDFAIDEIRFEPLNTECMAEDSVLILVMKDTTETQEVCTNALPYEWHGQSLTESNTYIDTIRSVSGYRDSICILNLTILYADTIDNNATICAGGSYTWKRDGKKDSIISEAGNYADTVRYLVTGCDSMIYRLALTVDAINKDSITAMTCAGVPYEWRGQSLLAGGIYRDTAQAKTTEECDTVYVLNLKVNDPTTSDTTAVECVSFTWHGTTYTASGDYEWKTVNVAGCDSTRTLHLTINQPTTSDTTAVECVSFTWHGTEYTASGDYEWKTVNVAGCDSTRTLHLTINQPTTSDTTAVECSSFVWHGTEYTTSGDYEWKTVNKVGCDSIRTLHLTINQPTTSDTTAVECSSFTWHGVVYSTSGNYEWKTVNVAGCDSIRTLHLTINQPTTSDTTAVECTSFMWHGTEYTASGDYEWKTVNVAGCDSTCTLHLTINQPTTSDTTAVECGSFTWHGTKYTASGDYEWKTVNAAGCDSIRTLHLTINQPTTSDTTAVECTSFTWHGTEYTASGDYEWKTINAVGCDSTRTLHLTINQPTTSDTTAVECGSFTWHGTTYTASGKYEWKTVNVAGCDSVRTLHLTINQPTTSDTTAVECSSFIWHGTEYTASGDYEWKTVNKAGCDSIRTLHLTIKDCGCPEPTIKPTDVVNICDTLMPYTWKASKEIKIFKAGHYSDTLRTKSGCDSIIYFLDLSTYTCCKPLAGTIEVRDICADEPVMDVIVKLTYGHFTSYRVHYTNAPGNTMPFRDTLVTSVPQEQDGHVLLTLPVPHDAADRKRYPRPDEYTIAITLYNSCGDSLTLTPQTFNVLYPSWLLDQHWDDVIAILNDRYNGGYTFSKIEWLRNGEVLPGEDELYVFLPHQLWNNEQDEHRDYQYQALLTRADDGKTMLSCPMTPLHIDSTNVLTEPYVAVTPTLVPIENPVVHVQTNTEGTYWLYSATGKLLQTADYEPCEHNVFDIYLTYNVQTMYILVFTPRNETKPLQKKYRVVKLLVE